jgi:hypothetical protein
MHILQNIIINFTNIKNDYLGITINPLGILHFLIHIAIALSIFLVFYLFGNRIRKLFFNLVPQYSFFINMALGFICIGTGIGILGIFSLLKSPIIPIYLLVITGVAFYSFPFKRLLKLNLKFYLKNIRKINLRKNYILLLILLFVLISFLRLMTPEVAEDGYHTDLPHLYLTTHTTIHETKDPLHVIPYPQLAEMIYVIPLYLGDKEATRFIHFGFYLLIILLLFRIGKLKQFSFTQFAPLLFASAPVVVRYASSQYIDFFMNFSFVLALVLLKEKSSKRESILSGIILGAAFSIKLWTLVYLPVVLLYQIFIKRKQKVSQIIQSLIIFSFSALLTPLLWYIRDFIITGNPLYPLFAKIDYLEKGGFSQPAPSYFTFNWDMFTYPNMSSLSPLFFLGIIFFIFNFKTAFKLVKSSPLFIFFIFITCEQLFIRVSSGRYILVWYIFSTLIISAGIDSFINKNKMAKYCVYTIYGIILTYYLINTLFILPYGFGWANKNRYLTRVLSRDNVSYYDFDGLFNKWISQKDLVATYGIGSYYYANFSSIDINYIFSDKKRSFNLLRKNGVTKLLIKGGDIVWFCDQLSLTKCDINKIKLLATYPTDLKKYNLYSLEK